MKHKKAIIITSVCLVIGLLLFGIFRFIKSMEEDRKEVEANQRLVNENYEKFNQYIEKFNSQSESLQKTMGSELYYMTLPSKNKSLVLGLTQLDTTVGNIEQVGKILEEKCQYYYSDTEVNQKCQSYKVSIENVMTLFKNAVNNYNKVVTSYNQWAIKQEGNTYSTLKEYQAKSINS